MRKFFVLASIAALIASFASVNAQGLFGFRHLKLDGVQVAWNAWTGEAKPAHVTYAFARSRIETPNAINCGAIGPIDPILNRSNLAGEAFRKEVRAAFDLWESVIDITFTETDDPERAGILIGAQLEPTGWAFANVSYKPGQGHARSIERSLICLNPEQRWKIGFDGNLAVYDIRYTTAHEIGHAIGLDHPGAPGQVMHHRYEERFRTLQAGDIQGAALLYGLRTPPHEGKQQPETAVATATARE